MKDEISNTDREYVQEIARILGHSDEVTKVAAALSGTPANSSSRPKVSLTKTAQALDNVGLDKLASMPLRDILENEQFCRGFYDEIEARRSVWEPAVLSWLNGE